ncbi:hypothetical protein VKT23_016219 [Stygiomarasmius scandens]|uniref:Uncharacterized protein n=1 Tax=Marasmiellus scandens TaxID=2682957 RepID=A0ABR1J000_9AGAR
MYNEQTDNYKSSWSYATWTIFYTFYKAMPVFRTLKHSERVQTHNLISGPPRECLSVLMHCLDIDDLPPEVTTRTPERAAKYLIVLEMFPRLRHLLSCPATNLPHLVAVSEYGTFRFQCSRCDVLTVKTLLSLEHHRTFLKYFRTWLADRARERCREGQDRELQRMFQELDEIKAFNAEFKLWMTDFQSRWKIYKETNGQLQVYTSSSNLLPFSQTIMYYKTNTTL